MGEKEAYIVREAQHNLRSAVPACGDIFGHEALLLLLVEAAGETKVADLELAVGVNKKVPGFEVTMKHVRGVDIL